MTNDSQQAIRAARAAINDAISRRDSEGIAAFFLPTYHVVTARSMHRDGKEQSRRSWADMFERDKSAIYGRTPDEIYVNEEWGMAEEHGRWMATVMAIDGLLEVAGVYAAKWHYTAEGWLLEGEIFTPLTIVRPEAPLP